MQAIIEDRGRQYLVSTGESLLVDRMPDAAPGSQHVFDHVLMVDGRFGAPFVAGAKVTATIDGEHRSAKLHVHKFRRRKDYRRRTGHRQLYTRLTISSIG